MNKVSEYITSELNIIKANANFTDAELEVFDLLAKDKTIIYIADRLNLSPRTVCRVKKRINNKISKLAQ